jgi:hypothetical protein
MRNGRARGKGRVNKRRRQKRGITKQSTRSKGSRTGEGIARKQVESRRPEREVQKPEEKQTEDRNQKRSKGIRKEENGKRNVPAS